MFTITLTAVTISILINISLLITHRLTNSKGESSRLFKNLLYTNLITLISHFFGYSIMKFDLTDNFLLLNYLSLFISLTIPAMFCFCVIKYSISLSEHTKEKIKSISSAYTIPVFIHGILQLLDSLAIIFFSGAKNFYEIPHLYGFFYYIPQLLNIFIMTIAILKARNHVSKIQLNTLLSLSICMVIAFVTVLWSREDFSSTATTLSLMSLFLFVQKDIIKIETNTVESISNIFKTVYYVDLLKGTYEVKGDEFSYVKKIREKEKTEMLQDIHRVMTTYFEKENQDIALEFTDLRTLPFRMENKTYISCEALDINLHWWRMLFIRVGKVDTELTNVIFAAWMIDEEKKKEENLLKTSYIDEMTGVYNRNAYITHTNNMKMIPRNFWFIGVDVNGLKKSNDTFGHEAGDELIKGTANCLKNAVSENGTVYRIGGDEFVILINATQYQFKLMLEDIWKNMKNWKGKYDQTLSFSLGYASSEEIWNPDISKLSKTADKRMYAHKKDFYDFHSWLNRRL